MSPHLLGRAHELQRLGELSHEARERGGAFVHIIGESGIGKSSLLESARDELSRHSIAIIGAAATETDRRRPLSLLRRLCGDFENAPTSPIDAALERLEDVVATSPVAVLVDDVQWADDQSLDVLCAIIRRVRDLGIVVVTAARPGGVSGPTTRLEQLAVELGTCLRPGPLSADALVEMAERRFGAAPGPALMAELRGTAGNPFLATELLAALVSQDALVTHDDVVDVMCTDADGDRVLPADVWRRLALRALTVVPDADLVMRVVAATPNGARADELAALFELPLTDLVHSLLVAVDAGVLVDDGETLRYRHDLLRRAVVKATASSVSQSLLRRFADVLVDTGADPDRVAVCLAASGNGRSADEVERLLTLARRYKPTHPSAAADIFELALHSFDAGDARADGVTVELGWCLVSAGRSAEVDALLDQRFTMAPADAPVEVQRMRGISASLSGRLDAVVAQHVDLDVTRLSDLYDPTDSDVVDAVAELAFLRMSTAQPAEAEAIVDWVEQSPTESSPFRRASIATVRGEIAILRGYFEEGVAFTQAALAAVAQDETHRATTPTPALFLAVALDLLGDTEAALAATAKAPIEGMPRWGPPLLQFFRTLTLYRCGEWDDAVAEVDACKVATDETDVAMASFWPAAVATLIASARDDAAHATAVLEAAYQRAEEPGLGREWLGLAGIQVAEANGDADTALVLCEMVVKGIAAAEADAMFLNGGADLVRLSLEHGRADLAECVESSLQTVKSRTGSVVAEATSTWCSGLMTDDPVLICEAAESLVAIGRRPDAAKAFHQAAVVASRHGDQTTGRRLAKLAFEQVDALGADQWRRRFVADLRAEGLDVRPRRPRSRDLTGWGSLTPTEESVVGLVSKGLTNSEIAARLFVSRRTVESHLGRIYPKVQLSSRQQLIIESAKRAS